MTTQKLNDLSKEEIERLRAELFRKQEAQRTVRECLVCGKPRSMRQDQKYCSPKCRKAAHDEKARLLYEKLLQEKAQWELERAEFIKEIQELKRKLYGKA